MRRTIRQLVIVLLFTALAGCSGASVDCDVYRGEASLDTSPKPENRPVPAPVIEQARIDYHGADREGADGRLSMLGYDLTLLHHEYLAHTCSNTETPFTSHAIRSNKAVQNNTVLLEVTAANATETENDLRSIGAQDVQRDQKLIIARVPIENLSQFREFDVYSVVIPQ